MSSVKQWEQYYRTGAFATGPVGMDGSYDLEVKALWLDFFKAMPKQGRILDIATGNGVITGIALDASKQAQLDLEIHGSDLAKIQPLMDVPKGAERMQGVHFHPGVATEHLPMPDASFDAVSGHYALEYSKPNEALTQIFRVLKPLAPAQFVVHHKDSVLVKNAIQSITEGKFVLSTLDLYGKLRALISFQGNSPEQAMLKAQPLRLGIQELKQRMRELAPLGFGQITHIALDATQKLLQMHGKMPVKSLVVEVDRAEMELSGAIERVNDLVAVAKSDQGIKELCQIGESVGLKMVQSKPLNHNGSNLVGWVLEFLKPNSSI